MKIRYLIFILSIISVYGFMQLTSKEEAYVFPINPGKRNLLSGTMGELRSTHFHAGIDIKTNEEEGYPVYATADGHIARIKISTVGYGNVLYLQHEDGNTSVYAHLSTFKDDIARYVKSAQYKKEAFEVELFPEKTRFKIKRGEVIARSGNTGSSMGPHLHFEIRNSRQEALNPLDFEFDEIIDDISPTVLKVALKTLDKEARINHQFGRFEFDLIREGKGYMIKEPIEAYGAIGVEILTYDRLNGAPNKNGVPEIALTIDGEKAYYQHVKKLSFAKMRNIMVHTDYAVMKETGRRFDKLYVEEGNELGFYKTDEKKGRLYIKDTLIHHIKINLWDAYKNQTDISFKLQGIAPAKKTASINKRVDSQILHNTLVLNTADTTSLANIFVNRMKVALKPAYALNQHPVFLWDLRKGLPDSVIIGKEKWYPQLQAAILPQGGFQFFNERMDIYFPKRALFDTLYLKTDYQHRKNHQIKEVFSINKDNIPLRSYIHVSLKPQYPVSNKKKVRVYSINKKKTYDFEGGEWHNNMIKFKTRTLGRYVLLADTVPPKIEPISINSKKVSFVITDDLSGIKHYKATVNGKWLLMAYEKKENFIWSVPLDEKMPLKGKFVLKVYDKAGNAGSYTVDL